ncbi:hypothetical protein JIN77_06240 [Verrucomicrobiaceae bacterium R5-34]|nr:hypothetical protein [Verrucomicrobiaceae bacterium R5-34]
MTILNARSLAWLASILLLTCFQAQANDDFPSEQEATSIIATHEEIKASFYQVIRMTPGKHMGKDGFIQENVLRVSVFAPNSASHPSRVIKHYLMQYHPTYGWFLEKTKEDSRGVYLEISSQKQGRIYLR